MSSKLPVEGPSRLSEVVAMVPEDIWKVIFTLEMDVHMCDLPEARYRRAMLTFSLQRELTTRYEPLFRKWSCVCRCWSKYLHDLVRLYFVFDASYSNWILKQLTFKKSLCIRSVNETGVIRDETLEMMTDLQFLHLDHKAIITNNSLKKLTNLEKLELDPGRRTFPCSSNSSLITDDGISRLTNLRSLSFGRFYRFGDDSVWNLTQLHLPRDTSITEAAITRLSNLSSLSYYGDLLEGMKLSNDALSHLTNLTEIKIEAEDTVSDATLMNLVKLKSAFIQGNISEEQDFITDESITKLTNLTDLGLFQCRAITANALLGLPKLVILESSLGRDITDCDMKKFTNLTSLSVFGNKHVTNEGITTLTNLTELNIECCENVSEDINRYLPKVR